MTDLRLLLPALAAWGAAAALTAAPGALSWAVPTLWGVALLAAGAAITARVARPRSPHPRSRPETAALIAVALCLASAAAGMVGVAVAAALPDRRPAALVPLEHHVVAARATVTSPASTVAGGFGGFGGFGGDRTRFTATTTVLTAGGTTVRARVPTQVFAPTGTRVRIGEVVEVRGTLGLLPVASSTTARVYASAAPRHVGTPSAPLAVAGDMRASFARLSAELPGDGGVLLPGLAIGDVHALPTSLVDAMKQASLTHLTAVSGANCAVVVSLVGATAGALGAGRGTRTAASLVALGGFVVLVTPQPSVLRAAVMAAVIVVGGWAGRPGRAVPALALAIIGLLAVDPWLARDYGFVLSVLATGALLLVSPALTVRLSRWMPTRLAAVLSVPIAAQLACQPVLLLLTPTLPLYSVPANLVAEPAAPVATVLGLIACLLAPWWPAAGSLVVHVAWLPAAWIAAVARTAEALPLHGLQGFAGVVGMVGVCAGTIAVLVLVSAPRHRAARRARIVVAGAGAALVGCLVAGSVGARVGDSLSRPADWTIAACDIGQGDGVLVRSAGAVALIDVGPDPAPLKECLTGLRISRIDLLVLTHYDSDHVGGLAGVLGRVDLALVGPPDGPRGEDMDAALARSGARVHVAVTGDEGRLGRATWRVLWPDADRHGMEPGNERSVTVLFEDGGTRSLFLGDLDERAQSTLLDTGRVPPVDIVKVAHHGSADQSEALYRHLDARVALISCGAGNDYGHPTATALGILRRTGAHVMRTDLQGQLLLAAAPRGGLRVWSQHAASTGRVFTPARGR